MNNILLYYYIMNKYTINKKIEKYVKKLSKEKKLEKINRYEKRIRFYRRELIKYNDNNNSESE